MTVLDHTICEDLVLFVPRLLLGGTLAGHSVDVVLVIELSTGLRKIVPREGRYNGLLYVENDY